MNDVVCEQPLPMLFTSSTVVKCVVPEHGAVSTH